MLISREDGRRLVPADRRAALVCGLALMAVIGWACPCRTMARSARRSRCGTSTAASERTVAATIRLEPRDSVKDPEFMNVTGWQGGGSVIDPLEKVGPGVYRTTKPIPVFGGWKSTLRIQQGDALISMPLFMPKDEAIPAAEVPAKANFTRAFQPDIEVLQREKKQDVSRPDADRVPHRAGDRAGADSDDRVGRCFGSTAARAGRRARAGLSGRGPNSCETALKNTATGAEISASFTDHAESALARNGGTRLLVATATGANLQEKARKLFQREPVS